MELTKEPKTKKEVIEAADDIFDALWHALPKEGNASVGTSLIFLTRKPKVGEQMSLF